MLPPGIVGAGDERGSIMWNLPTQMHVWRNERVEVRLSDTDVAVGALRGKVSPTSLPKRCAIRVNLRPPARLALLVDSAKPLWLPSLRCFLTT